MAELIALMQDENSRMDLNLHENWILIKFTLRARTSQCAIVERNRAEENFRMEQPSHESTLSKAGCQSQQAADPTPKLGRPTSGMGNPLNRQGNRKAPGNPSHAGQSVLGFCEMGMG